METPLNRTDLTTTSLEGDRPLAKSNVKWKEIRLGDWEQFDEAVEGNLYRSWVYRGQSDSNWILSSSIYRLFEDHLKIYKKATGKNRKLQRIRHEELLIDSFKSSAHLFLSHLPADDETFEWLALMQHFGAPTRLLDVTFSPHIACHFALGSGTEDAAIFGFKPQYFSEIDKNDLKSDPGPKNILLDYRGDKAFFAAYEPRFSNERLLAQQGLFLAPSTVFEPFDTILENYKSGNSAVKFIIPKHLRLKGLKRLKRMNITSSSLFPGIDGFCRSLKVQILETTQRLRRYK